MNRTCGQPAQASISERNGFKTYNLRSDNLELSVVPQLGAAIVSLRSVRSGREWMWQRPDAAGLFSSAWGDPFENGPLVGAVECLPTISPCTGAGRSLPDHGEAWTAVWDLDAAAFDNKEILTSVLLPVSQLEFRRSIRLDGPVASFEYTLGNPSPQAIPYLWAFHPLLAVDEGDRLELPTSVANLRAHVSQGFPELSAAPRWNWPEPVPGLRLDELTGARRSGTFAKLFAEFPTSTVGCATLCRGPERLEFRFDPPQIPYLGLWFTNGAWHGFTHVAIEPTNALTDDLTMSKCVLPGLSQRSWRFEIILAI